MPKRLFLFLLLILLSLAQVQRLDSAMAAEETLSVGEAWADSEMLILLSTKNYAEAAAFIKKAEKTLGIPIDLRGLKPHKGNGLTFSKQECQDDGSEYPCYAHRIGIPDSADTLSIEYSNDLLYKGLTQGYYIVVAGLAPLGSTHLQSLLKQARQTYPDAYVKKIKVYVGCMH